MQKAPGRRKSAQLALDAALERVAKAGARRARRHAPWASERPTADRRQLLQIVFGRTRQTSSASSSRTQVDSERRGKSTPRASQRHIFSAAGRQLWHRHLSRSLSLTPRSLARPWAGWAGAQNHLRAATFVNTRRDGLPAHALAPTSMNPYNEEGALVAGALEKHRFRCCRQPLPGPSRARPRASSRPPMARLPCQRPPTAKSASPALTSTTDRAKPGLIARPLGPGPQHADSLTTSAPAGRAKSSLRIVEPEKVWASWR